MTLAREGSSAVFRICRTVPSVSSWRHSIRSGMARIGSASASFFSSRYERRFTSLDARGSGSGRKRALALLVPQAPQPSDPPVLRKLEDTPAGLVGYGHRLECAARRGVAHGHLHRLRACLLRSPDAREVLNVAHDAALPSSLLKPLLFLCASCGDLGLPRGGGGAAVPWFCGTASCEVRVVLCR